MRLLFGILLSLCAMLFVVIQSGGLSTSAGKGSIANGEMNPEKVHLIRNGQAGSAPVAVTEIRMQPASAISVSSNENMHSPMTKAQSVPQTPLPVVAPKEDRAPTSVPPKAAVAARSEALLCMQWGEFSGTDLERMEKSLASMNLGAHLSRRTVEYSSGFWVFIPPQKTRAALSRKIQEIKAAGVEEYYVLRDAKKWHNAISLGIFKTEEAAQQYMAVLKKKKIQDIQVGERKGSLKYILFIFNELSSDQGAGLEKLSKDFPGSELKKTSCAEPGKRS